MLVLTFEISIDSVCPLIYSVGGMLQACIAFCCLLLFLILQECVDAGVHIQVVVRIARFDFTFFSSFGIRDYRDGSAERSVVGVDVHNLLQLRCQNKMEA